MNKLLKFFIKWQNDLDLKVVFLIFIFYILSILLVGSADIPMSIRIGTSKFSLLKKQLLFSSFGFILMLFISTLATEYLHKFSKFLFFVFLSLLILNIFLGTEIKGSQRWINLKFISIQPSELIKPFFIVIQSYLLSLKIKNLNFLLFLANGILVVFFIFIQPDLGTSFIYLSIIWLQAFIANVAKFFIFIMPFFMSILIVLAYLTFPHVQFRIDSYINNEVHYQAMKSILAIKNGGLFGVGLGNGQIKYHLPDSYTDYIFAVLSEEFGYIGVIFILFIYIKLFYRMLFSVREFLDPYSKEYNICISIVFSLFMQFCINILVATNSIPTKGSVLPFLSYGGSSILSSYIMLGIFLCFTRKSYGIKKNINIINRYE